MYVHMHTCDDVLKSKDNLRELVLYFHQIGTRDQTPVIRLATVSSCWPIVVHLIFLNLMCICVRLSVFMCTMYMQCPWVPEDMLDAKNQSYRQLWVARHGWWELSPGSLEEQLPLQPPHNATYVLNIFLCSMKCLF